MHIVTANCSNWYEFYSYIIYLCYVHGNGPLPGRSCPESETSQLRAGLLPLASYFAQQNAVVGRDETVNTCYLELRSRGYLPV